MKFGRLQISVFLGLAVVVWFLALFIQGVSVSWDHAGPFSSVVGVLSLTVLAFEKQLWHQKNLHGWFVKRPDLRGTWRVELRSDWKNPKTGEGVPPIHCFMCITQTFSTLQMHLMTKESRSWIVAESIRPSRSGRGYEIVGVYTNEPGVGLRGVISETHRGGLILDSHGPEENKPDTLSGEYWTDRRTTGTMKLFNRQEQVFTSYEEALAASDDG